MAKSKLGMSSFDIDIKFKDKEEARKYAKRVLEKIRCICKKKNWSATAMVCISNTEGNKTLTYYEHSGKVGRPKKVKEAYLPYRNKDISTEWHLHIIMASKPYHSFRDELKAYFDKNWLGWKKNADIDITKLYGKGTYKKNTNIKKAEYFIKQAEETLFCTYNNNDEVVIPKGYTLKDLYNAYMNSKTALRYARSTGNEKRLALENKYYDIANFYWNITKEQDKKMVDKFMKEVRLIKIQDNYDLREKNNKVQKNMSLRRRIVAEDSPF